ncbi:hypothetical protein N0V93_000327 [Gnomoniopsis smithogilvyi]|uniref:Uncharacterized protein n=1 Tax=Gnomoniopsis smithogilvyi TaxID=1191159 RepID=A0A9W9D1L5_9PEZI|nr:hypothetical protein N0V93_000327 [Gnomoniopsis smithogilvyi]
MPVVTAGSESLPLFHNYICEHQWHCSQSAIPVIIIAIILAVVFLPRQSRKQQFPDTPICVTQHVTWTTRARCSLIKSTISSVSNCWVQLKQGQGHFEKWANRAVSRGEASGTALVGLGGSREGGDMEEEERAPAEPRSRGVSKEWSDGAGISSGLPSPDQLLVTAEQSNYVGYGAKGIQEEGSIIGDARFGEPVGLNTGSGSDVIKEARGRVSASFGDYMADDEHILYGTREWITHTASDSAKRPHTPWPLTPPASAAGVSSGLATGEGHLRSIAIPSRIATGFHPTRNIGSEESTEKDGAIHRSDGRTSPSSYPPTSPLLPPAPPTEHEAFDPAAVMFPGPARDGGIRVVPPHSHGSEHGPSNMQIASSPDNPGASWARHTRVYGGGVCLACAAAAAGEGGFYGDSVRPEDRR